MAHPLGERVANGSFESPSVIPWTFTNASLINIPLTGTNSAFLGPAAGPSSIQQDVGVAALHFYELKISIAPQVRGQHPPVSVTVDWLDALGALIPPSPITFSLVANELQDAGYLTFYRVTSRAPEDAVRARITVATTIPGSGTPGILVDDVSFVDTGEIDPCPRGEFLLNSSFESDLIDWTFTNVIVTTRRNAHSGNAAAALGGLNNKGVATLFQDVPFIFEEEAFQLCFHVAGRRRHPADLRVRVLWLNAVKAVMGTGIDIDIPAAAMGKASRGKWTTYVAVTDRAPVGVRFARTIFEKAPGRKRRNFIALDDVSFVCQ